LEHQEVPKEEDTGALKEWYGDQHLATGRRWQPKKQTQGNVGSWNKLAATHRHCTA
jgi:hypothetical protein